MSDQPASPNPSYVDSYMPPSSTPSSTPASTWTPVSDPAVNPPVTPMMPPAAVPDPAPAIEPVRPSMPDFTQPNPNPAPTPPPVAAAPAVVDSQTLEDQNIFDLLGVVDATEAEKEAFLDELQQVIWEDFLENDVELLLTEAEMAELKTVMGDKNSNDLEQQEKIVIYLEKLVPDLEEIMLEKALELKADMVKERITSMKEFFATQPEKLTSVDKAEGLISEDQWRTAADTLNSLS